MEKFSFEQTEPETEKTALTSAFETLGNEQAAAYERYLTEGSETQTTEERVRFSMWTHFNYSPDDIKTIGQENAEAAGKKYDIEKNIQEYEQKESKLGLAKEQLKATFNIAVMHTKFAFRWGLLLLVSRNPKIPTKKPSLEISYKALA